MVMGRAFGSVCSQDRIWRIPAAPPAFSKRHYGPTLSAYGTSFDDIYLRAQCLQVDTPPVPESADIIHLIVTGCVHFIYVNTGIGQNGLTVCTLITGISILRI